MPSGFYSHMRRILCAIPRRAYILIPPRIGTENNVRRMPWLRRLGRPDQKDSLAGGVAIEAGISNNVEILRKFSISLRFRYY
jgi:hypothetical protein